MKRKTKSAFFLFLCAAQFFGCDSFSFGNLFGRNSDQSKTPSSVHVSSSKPTEVVLKLENVLSEENLETEYNISLSSLVDMFENSSESNWRLLSELNNATEYIVSSSSSVAEEITHVPVKSDQAPSDSSSTSESSLEGNDALNVTQNSSFNTSAEEQEGPSTITLITKTIYQKTVEWVGDTYTMSILIPVAAGILFAVTIIFTVATCRCMRRACRRRRFRKRVLPDSIKDLRPADRTRLLGDCDSSDEEF